MPLSGVIADDYNWAIIHLAWWRKGQENERTLIFGFIELLPKEFPKPKSSLEAHQATTKISPKSDLRYHRIAFKAVDAIAWYESAFSGKFHHPLQTEDELKTGYFQQVPTWPMLSFAENIGDTHPFLGGKWGGVRTHSAYVPELNVELERIFSVQKHVNWLSEQFLFDFSEFPILRGSLHCIAPNPVLRQVDVTLGQPKDGNECADIHIIPREGFGLDGLTLIYEESTPNGIGINQIIPVSDPFLRVHHGQDIGKITTSIFCAKRGLISREGPYGFLKSINMKIDIHSEDREVTVPAGGSRKTPSTYPVLQTSSGTTSTIGKERKKDDIRLRLSQAQRQRDTRRDGARFGQKWFHKNQDEAEKFVRQKISHAKERVWIIDPYFAAQEFFSFPMAVTRSEVTIRILSSAEVLKKESTIAGATGMAGEVFQQQLEHLKTRISNSVEVKVMTGKRPEIHDRFLVIDDEIWLSGISLNEIGKRGAILIKLPDPAPVLRELEMIWENDQRVKPLKEWLAASNNGEDTNA